MRLRSLIPAAALVAASLSFTTSYAGTISIGIGTGGAITTEATGNGAASFTGTYGMFVFNQIQALGSPVLNPQGNFSTSSIQASTTSAPAGTIYVYITQQDLTSPTSATPFLSTFTSNLFQGNVDSVKTSTYYSTSNALYTGTLLASDTFTGSGLTTASSTDLAALTGTTYSETVIYAIKTSGGAATVNDSIQMTPAAVTPEPSSLALLGTGLVGAASMALRRRKLIA